jgi:hypothetical protein
VLDRWCLIPGISGGSAHVIKPVVMWEELHVTGSRDFFPEKFSW